MMTSMMTSSTNVQKVQKACTYYVKCHLLTRTRLHSQGRILTWSCLKLLFLLCEYIAFLNFGYSPALRNSFAK